MTAVKWISILATILGAVVGVFTINWQGILHFGTSINFLYENLDHIEHVVEDSHRVVELREAVAVMESQIDSLKNILFVVSNRDSLIHVIELMNSGKLPYDSIWVKGPSGYWYRTTVETHFNTEHHD